MASQPVVFPLVGQKINQMLSNLQNSKFFMQSGCGINKHFKIWFWLQVLGYIYFVVQSIKSRDAQNKSLLQKIISNVIMFVQFLFALHATYNCKIIEGIFWSVVYGFLFSILENAIFG